MHLLADNDTLKTLSANHCGLGLESALMMQSAVEANQNFKNNSKLALLEVKGNDFGCEGRNLLLIIKQMLARNSMELVVDDETKTPNDAEPASQGKKVEFELSE